MQSLLDVCIESVGELIRSNFGKEVLYEVVNMMSMLKFLEFYKSITKHYLFVKLNGTCRLQQRVLMA